MRLNNDTILIIGDDTHAMQAAVASAIPTAALTVVHTLFDAIAELHAGMFSGVLLATRPLESRPEAALHTLREAAGEGRIVLYAEPAHEPLSRRLTEHGADDYVIAPADARELQQAMTCPVQTAATPGMEQAVAVAPSADGAARFARMLLDMPVADIVLSAMMDHPQRAAEYAVSAMNHRLGGLASLHLRRGSDMTPPPSSPSSQSGRVVLHQPVRSEGSACVAQLFFEINNIQQHSTSAEASTPDAVDCTAAQHALAYIASVISKAQQIDDRQSRLQRLAITDDLTGLNNARYFKHFLARIIEKAKQKRFPVTLLLFDIDNFKRYNDTYGHGVGDEILKQTASLMRRCCRDHDLVARISGDEFAVVFWEKEGPRQAYDASNPPARLPATPLMIADRFRKMVGNKDFQEYSLLGPSGKGVLTISGGMAVYPYDAQTPEQLIDAADKALMFGAKKGGKNSIYLVGGNDDATATPVDE
jgi:diguanylate cyclase (GGDEF)-like protein